MTMGDLIPRKAAIEEFEEMVTSVSVYGESAEARYANNARLRFIEKLADIPSVPAVPLDDLCDWLENNCILSCVSCEHLFGGQWCKQHPELPYRCHRKEHWKNVLTKWMEGLEHG